MCVSKGVRHIEIFAPKSTFHLSSHSCWVGCVIGHCKFLELDGYVTFINAAEEKEDGGWGVGRSFLVACMSVDRRRHGRRMGVRTDEAIFMKLAEGRNLARICVEM